MAREKKGLDSAAIGVGSALGSLAKRLDALNKQRAEIGAELRKAIAHGQELLAGLGHGAEPEKNKGGRPKGYVMSDETRAKLKAAWKNRKAEAAKSPVHDHTKTPNERTSIRSKVPGRRGG